MSLQENIKKNIFVPPLNHSGGGDILAVPPWIAQAGDNSQGGTVPPEIAQRGHTSLSPPVSALVCIYAYDFDDYDYDFYAVKEINELWIPFDWLLFVDSK